MNDADTLDFFIAQSQGFTATLAAYRGRETLIEAVLSQAFSSFDGNLALETEALPPIDCHKGCASCCTLRVTGTAAEILLIARYLRQTEKTGNGLNLEKRVVRADRATRGLSETQRVRLRQCCPFIVRGVCMIYPVRPLACRGHACYDHKACIAAAAGRLQQIPISEPHRLLRGLIQNALQLALRDAGYAWDLYELNQAVVLALAQPDCFAGWAAGGDVFAPAAIAETDPAEMARVFDRIKFEAGWD